MSRGSRAGQIGLAALPVLLTLLVWWPVLAERGVVLVGDMVFVPHQPWKDAWWGGDGGIPRAVPSDALVSGLTHLLPGDLVQKAILALTTLAAGLGMLRLTRPAPGASTDGWPWPPRAAAVVAFVWSPFVFERLLIGHWALLVGYAALPWVASAARELTSAARRLPRRSGGADSSRWRRWSALLVPLGAAAATSPTGGVIATLVAVGVVSADRTPAGRRVRGAVAVLGWGLLLNGPWVVAGLVAAQGQADVASAPEGVDAFAARADTAYGVLGSLLTGGGLWKTSVHAPGRESAVLAGLALLVALAAVATLAWSRRQRGRDIGRGLWLPAMVGLLVAWAPTTAPGAGLLRWVVAQLPAAGLLRDSQKWVAPTVLLLALGVGELCRLLLRHAEETSGRSAALGAGLARGAAAALVVVPVLAMPALAWGGFGRLEPVRYPPQWPRLAARLDAAGAASDRVLVLPLSTYRRFAWNDRRSILDPAPRLLPGEVIVDDRLAVGDRVTGPEDAAAAAALRLQRSAQTPQQLVAGWRRLGIDWVVVERRTPGPRPPVLRAALTDLPAEVEGRWLALYAVPGAEAAPSPAPADGADRGRRAVAGAAVVAAATWAASLAVGASAGPVAYTRRRREGTLPPRVPGRDHRA